MKGLPCPLNDQMLLGHSELRGLNGMGTKLEAERKAHLQIAGRVEDCGLGVCQLSLVAVDVLTRLDGCRPASQALNEPLMSPTAAIACITTSSQTFILQPYLGICNSGPSHVCALYCVRAHRGGSKRRVRV